MVMKNSTSLLIWLCLSTGFLITASGDGTKILGNFYQMRNEQAYSKKEPKDIAIMSINDTVVFIGPNSYSILNFGPMKRINMKRTQDIALIDKNGNTVSGQGGRILYFNMKTKKNHMVYIAENHNIYRMTLDKFSSRIFVIGRPDEEEPYGKLFVFDTMNPVIDSQNRVVTEELTYFGDHVSAIAIDPLVGNIIYSQVVNKSAWILRLLAPCTESTDISTTTSEPILPSGLTPYIDSTNETHQFLNNSFTTTSKPIITKVIPPKTESTNVFITTSTKPDIINVIPRFAANKNKKQRRFKHIFTSTTSKPIITNPKQDIIVVEEIVKVEKVTETSSKIIQPVSETKFNFEDVLKGYTNNLVYLYSQGSDERLKKLTLENKRLKFYLNALISKHEYLLANANIFFTPVNLFTIESSANVDIYTEKFVESVLQMENDLMKLVDGQCTN